MAGARISASTVSKKYSRRRSEEALHRSRTELNRRTDTLVGLREKFPSESLLSKGAPRVDASKPLPGPRAKTFFGKSSARAKVGALRGTRLAVGSKAQKYTGCSHPVIYAGAWFFEQSLPEARDCPGATVEHRTPGTKNKTRKQAVRYVDPRLIACNGFSFLRESQVVRIQIGRLNAALGRICCLENKTSCTPAEGLLKRKQGRDPVHAVWHIPCLLIWAGGLRTQSPASNPP